MLQEQKNEYSSVSSSSRGRQDSSYSRDRDYRGRERPEISDHSEDYSYTDIQSGLTETKQGDEEILRIIIQIKVYHGLSMLVFGMFVFNDRIHHQLVPVKILIMLAMLVIMTMALMMMVTGSSEEITVTHQVPTRTVFTVIERGETKSLFADVLETSLEVIICKTAQLLLTICSRW